MRDKPFTKKGFFPLERPVNKLIDDNKIAWWIVLF
jgi:hypothetical protein